MAEAYTCWSLIRDAAGGIDQAKEDFALKYEPVLRAYLGARWRGSPRIADLEDAVQEIFVECLKEGGVLERVDPDRGGGFRAFLYGVARRVALRYETGHGRKRPDRLQTAVVEGRDRSRRRDPVRRVRPGLCALHDAGGRPAPDEAGGHRGGRTP